MGGLALEIQEGGGGLVLQQIQVGGEGLEFQEIQVGGEVKIVAFLVGCEDFLQNNPFTILSIKKLCHFITWSNVPEWDFSPTLLIPPMHLLRLHSQYQSTLKAHVSYKPSPFSLIL